MIVVRPYLPSDKPQLMALIRANTPTYFAIEEEQDFSNYLDNELDAYFVVESDGEIIGCGGVNYADNKTRGVISWGMIHPDLHGKGIGAILLQHRLDFLKQQETISKITVRTSQLTYKFYEKYGFRLMETKKDFWAEGLDMYYMEYTK